MDSTTSRDGKPRLDETTFQKLLAAAYVIQQHHQDQHPATVEPRAGSGSADADYATTLAEIVETQHQIQLRHLDLDGSAGMVVDQIQKITAASGAAVCLLNREHLVYRAVSGLSVAEMGQAISRSQSISGQVLSQGAVLRCPDALADPHVDPLIVGRARIASFIAVPIFHEDQVAGALELTFNKPSAYREHDVRTCQLMAGLITEVLARTADDQWKKNLSAERDSMLEALEKLKPQLDRLVKEAEFGSARPSSTRSQALPRPPSRPQPPGYESVVKPVTNASVLKNEISRANVSTEQCHRCGHEISAQEVYCGNCGSLRADRTRADSTQRKGPGTWDAEAQTSDAFSSSILQSPTKTSPRPSFASNLVDKELQLPNEILALTKDEQDPEQVRDLGAELLKLLPPDPDGPGIMLPVEQPHLQSALEAPPARSAGFSGADTALTSLTPQPPTEAPHEPPTLGATDSLAAPEAADSQLEEQTESLALQSSAASTQGARPEAYPWTSAARARQWLNSISDPQTTAGLAGFLRTHRGDLSLGAAIVALLLVLVWGMSSHKTPSARPPATPTTGATGSMTTATGSPTPSTSTPSSRPRRKAPEPQPDLSLGERALVVLGLAEAPTPAPVTDPGNPDVKVWVDLKTALYYCPNAELYGNTPKGKYMSQREAQFDQFEPASRQVCE